MGFMDGAVNGMATRLVAAGFTPGEAFCLGQAAYIKEGKRDSRVPPTVVDRQTTSADINQTLAALGQFPMGVEAHRRRIRLWERIFGFGSWHEPIDPAEIYNPLELLAHGYSNSPSTSSDSPAAPAVATLVNTEAPLLCAFQIVVGSSQDGEFLDQMTEALHKAEAVLKRTVESAGYEWTGEGDDYSVFRVGDTELPTGIPEGALDRYFPGTVCVLGTMTAARRD